MQVMVDSGAFSAYNKGKVIDIQAYIQFIKDNEHRIDHYINLDVIGDDDASFNNYKIMRDANLTPIPVFHAGTDTKYLQMYLEMADYIAIGAIANLSTKERINSLDIIWREHLTDANKMPVAKFHGLGLTTAEIIHRYPWYSIDSSTWMMTSRRGIIIIPKKINGQFAFEAGPMRIEISSKSPHLSEDDGHLDTLSPHQKQYVIDYIESKGFKVGRSEWDEEGTEIIVEEGLCNRYLLRDQFNVLYFLELEKSIPEWPWPFDVQCLGTLF